ncbi:MAG: class I SAM-dependent methyltransferase [Akkermansiaceae bacterium]|nr:class I SAM-dependent methyltransferase [Akkermansiaceae bacterium]
MQPAKPYSYPGVAQDVVRLRSLLAVGLRAAGWTPPHHPTCLNLACGRADETGVLFEVLVGTTAPIFMLGLDLRAPEIDEARERWIPACAPGQELEFRSGDAAGIDKVQSLPPFDMVFIRHQNFWSTVGDWKLLFIHALAALKQTGVLVITSYFDKEHELATAYLQQIGAERLADLQHPRSRPLKDAPGKSVDRRLAVFRQSPASQDGS